MKLKKYLTFGVVDIKYKGKTYRVNVARIKPYIQRTNQPPPSATAITTTSTTSTTTTTGQPQIQQRERQMQQPQPEKINEPQPQQQHEPQAEADQPAAASAPRGRGRPRKQALPMPTGEHTQQQQPPTLQENRPEAAPSLPERRITRSMTAAAQQATEQQQQTAQIVGEILASLGRRDKFGIPILPPGVKPPSHYTSKRRQLKRLTVEKRNKKLTGDAAYPFDGEAYERPAFTHIQAQNPADINPDQQNPPNVDNDDSRHGQHRRQRLQRPQHQNRAVLGHGHRGIRNSRGAIIIFKTTTLQ